MSPQVQHTAQEPLTRWAPCTGCENLHIDHITFLRLYYLPMSLVYLAQRTQQNDQMVLQWLLVVAVLCHLQETQLYQLPHWTVAHKGLRIFLERKVWVGFSASRCVNPATIKFLRDWCEYSPCNTGTDLGLKVELESPIMLFLCVFVFNPRASSRRMQKHSQVNLEAAWM